jgi:hypothetical protein
MAALEAARIDAIGGISCRCAICPSFASVSLLKALITPVTEPRGLPSSAPWCGLSCRR